MLDNADDGRVVVVVVVVVVVESQESNMGAIHRPSTPRVVIPHRGGIHSLDIDGVDTNVSLNGRV
jgi:hypothetical protein